MRLPLLALILAPLLSACSGESGSAPAALAPSASPFASIAPATSASHSGRGVLLLEGGGPTVKEVSRRIIDLAPDDRRLCLIETAADGKGDSRRRFDGLGGPPRRVLNPGPGDGDDPVILAALGTCGAYFFDGGDPQRLSDTFRPEGHETAALALVRDRYEHAGATVSGSSAGAMIAGPVTLCECGPHSSVAALRQGRLFEAPGFGLVDGVLVDAHFFARALIGRHLVALARTKLPVGVGIDEETAVEVPPAGAPWRVVGSRAVAVIEAPAQAVEGRLEGFTLSLLRPGDAFDPAGPTFTVSPSRVEHTVRRDPAVIPAAADTIFIDDRLLGLLEELAQGPASEAIGYDFREGLELHLVKTDATRVFVGESGVTVLGLRVSVIRR